MVDACAATGILPFYGPFGDIRDVAGCEAQFRAAFLMGCVGAWSLHPVQIDIAKKVFSPDPDEVAFARKVIEAIPDGRGVHMIDGKMQDDATWKQCRVMVDLAEMLARKDCGPGRGVRLLAGGCLGTHFPADSRVASPANRVMSTASCGYHARRDVRTGSRRARTASTRRPRSSRAGSASSPASSTPVRTCARRRPTPSSRSRPPRRSTATRTSCST